VVIVQHFPGSVKQYAEAVPFPGRRFTVPDTCPDPECQASGCLIRWGTYERSARTGDAVYRILVQRVRCKACGHTHSLLPDFLHPHRHYGIHLLQHVVSLYLIVGLGWGRVTNRLPPPGPARSTVREWVASFAYGAGHLLLDSLIRQSLALDPLADLPDTGVPSHLDRVSDATKRLHLGRAHHFWLLAERLYAQLKLRSPRLHFAADQLLPFLLHWLQSQALPPRLFWNPTLSHTPTIPFDVERNVRLGVGAF
jgi:hypothetical protein